MTSAKKKQRKTRTKDETKTSNFHQRPKNKKWCSFHIKVSQFLKIEELHLVSPTAKDTFSVLQSHLDKTAVLDALGGRSISLNGCVNSNLCHPNENTK